MESTLVLEPPAGIRDRLIERRERLEQVIPYAPDPGQLQRLLRDVDEAIARVTHGSFGVCDACRGAVERERLTADPLTRLCLDCLSAPQQRALERDLDLAGQVQRTLLPARRLQAGGWHTAYDYQPLGPASGDYVDLVPLDSGDLVFVIGDVSGKGVAASLLMTHLHATIRSLVTIGLPFDEVLQRTNRIFHRSVGGSQYVTLLFGRAGRDGEVVLSNAGHCPPIVVRGGEATILPATSVPIGLFADAPFPSMRLTLDRSDSLIVYTDGVTEATDEGGREYGSERLVASALGHRAADVRDLVARCLADGSSFRRHDDVTLFALRRE
jgi:phosphoserine phosphatase RsbU/P